MAEKQKRPPGPEPGRLKLKGDWQKLVAKAMNKRREKRKSPTQK